MINVNWNRLREVYERLKEYIPDETSVIFHYTPIGHNKKRTTVRFEYFMRFFWDLYENRNIEVPLVVVADAASSRVLYKHQITRNANEKRPDGDSNEIHSWNKSGKIRKRTLLKILNAQIKSTDYDQTPK